MAKTASQMVAEAKQKVENLTVDQTAADLDGGFTAWAESGRPVEREE